MSRSTALSPTRTTTHPRSPRTSTSTSFGLRSPSDTRPILIEATMEESYELESMTKGRRISTESDLEGKRGEMNRSREDVLDEDDMDGDKLHREVDKLLEGSEETFEEAGPARGSRGGLGVESGREYLDEDEEDVSMEAMVARTCPTTDDPSLPSLTLRAIVLGSVFCVLGASASQIFYFKSNAPSFSSYFVLLSTYPMGHFLAKVVPKRRILGVELNPGPLLLVDCSCSRIAPSRNMSLLACSPLLVGRQLTHPIFVGVESLLIGVYVQRAAMPMMSLKWLRTVSILSLYYHETLGPIASITLLITTQSIGFGLAGMLQDILIKPTSMYWPSTLVDVQLFTTLHNRSDVLMTRRMRLFVSIGIVCFVYQFLPALFFPTLTSIATLCFVNNRSWLIRTLGSGYSGLGMLDFSLDWSTVGSGGPLYTPWWSQLNSFAGMATMAWIFAPIMLVTNFWQTNDFPSVASSGLFNSTNEHFDLYAVLNPDLSLNEEAWEKAQPLLLTPFFAISYAFSFSTLTAVLMHVWIWHRNEIKAAFSRRTAHSDIHNRLMEAYAPVPKSWYGAALVVNFLAAAILMSWSPLQLPVWALALAVGIAALFLVPIGIITAVSNVTIGLNVLTEFVCGILLPGKPIANVTFKCYGYMAMSQAVALLSDQKLGHYMHINPKDMFSAQWIGTVLGCLINYVTVTQVMATKHAYLDGSIVDPTSQWTGRAPAMFYSASVIWGLVAPTRFFAGKYVWLYLGFPLGAIVPVITYYLHQRYPRMWFDKISFPVFCHGLTQLPERPTNIITTSFIVAYGSNVWFAKRYPRAHKNFIYTVSSALDAATSLNALFVYALTAIFFGGTNIPQFFSATDSEHCTPST